MLRCGRADGCEAARAGGLSCEPATLTTLDSLLEGWGDLRSAVVKMDVEGAECDVLKGGQRLFSRSLPRFLYAELKQPHVEACWRETALRRTATARRRRGCERRPAGPYSSRLDARVAAAAVQFRLHGGGRAQIRTLRLCRLTLSSLSIKWSSARAAQRTGASSRCARLSTASSRCAACTATRTPRCELMRISSLHYSP